MLTTQTKNKQTKIHKTEPKAKIHIVPMGAIDPSLNKSVKINSF